MPEWVKWVFTNLPRPASTCSHDSWRALRSRRSSKKSAFKILACLSLFSIIAIATTSATLNNPIFLKTLHKAGDTGSCKRGLVPPSPFNPHIQPFYPLLFIQFHRIELFSMRKFNFCRSRGAFLQYIKARSFGNEQPLTTLYFSFIGVCNLLSLYHKIGRKL